MVDGAEAGLQGFFQPLKLTDDDIHEDIGGGSETLRKHWKWPVYAQIAAYAGSGT